MTSLRRNKTGSFDVRDEAGTLLASFADYWTAHCFVDDREAGCEGEEELTAERAEEIERENLCDDLCELMDPSDLQAMTTEELRAMAANLN